MKRFVTSVFFLAAIVVLGVVAVRSYYPDMRVEGDTQLELARSITENVNKSVANNSFKVTGSYIDDVGIDRLYVDQKGRPYSLDVIAGQHGSTAPLATEQTLWYTIVLTGPPVPNRSTGGLMPLSPADDALMVKGVGLILKLTTQYMIDKPRSFKFVGIIVTPLINSDSAPGALYFAVSEEELFVKANLEWSEKDWEQFALNHIQGAQFMPVVKVNIQAG